MPDRTVKIGDIARELGVSEATVSLALNSRAGINEQTKQRVLECAREMGYIPNSLAKSLAMRQSNLIGIVTPSLENAYFCAFARALSDEVIKRGYQPMIAVSGSDVETERIVIEKFISYHADGILVVPTSSSSGDIGILKKRGMPYVLCGSFYENMTSPSVFSDLEKGSYELFTYFLRQGIRRIVLAGGLAESPSVQRRLAGIRRAYEEASVPYDLFTHFSVEHTFQMGYDMTLRILETQRETQVIVMSNDYMALGALKALTEQGVQVPRDILLAEYDNSILIDMAYAPMISVAQDVEGMSRCAADMLFRQIERKPLVQEQVKIDTSLVIRG